MAEKMPKVKAKQPQPCGQYTVTVRDSMNSFWEDWPTEYTYDEIDFLSILLTGPEAKEIVIFGEDNPTFDIALATARNNSWEGISYGVRHVLKFQEKKLRSIELCSKMGRQQGLSEIEIMSRFQDMLKTPAPPPKVKGKVVWYQYPWTKKELSVKEVVDEMEDQQKKGDYLLLGKLSNADCYSSDCPNYSFFGIDRKFVNKLVSYGYCYQGEKKSTSFEEHLIFVLQKK
uniref:Uncharacterized protein n=1 Tax=Amphimedon queenslandica TaxID=400682 RepID=A0A1X7SGE0_AMPQE